jgi:hypothetical protein
MGFSFVAQGVLAAHLPDQPWRPLIAVIGSSGKRGTVEDRRFESEFLDPGVRAFAFTFGLCLKRRDARTAEVSLPIPQSPEQALGHGSEARA